MADARGQPFRCPAPGCSETFPDLALFGQHYAALHHVAQGNAHVAGTDELHIMENPKVWPHQKLVYEELRGISDDLRAGKEVAFKILIDHCVGSGKTSTLAMVGSALRAKRILIISPNKSTREEVMAKLCGTKDMSRKSFLEDVGALKGAYRGPKVWPVDVHARELANPHYLKSIMECDVIVATAPKISNLTGKAPPPAPSCKGQPSASTSAAGGQGGSGKKGKKRKQEGKLSEGITALSKATRSMLESEGKPAFDVIIFDEAHHCPAETWRRILESLGEVEFRFTTANGQEAKRKPFLVFMTGTSHRIVGKTDFPIDRVLTRFTLHDALKTYAIPGATSDAEVGPFIKSIVMLNVHSGSGDPGAHLKGEGGRLDYMMACMRVIAHLLRQKRNGSDVQHRALITVSGVLMCKELMDAINNAKDLVVGPSEAPRKIRAGMVYGDMADDARQHALEGFKTSNGEHPGFIDVLINDKLVGEGFDVPIISVVGILKSHKTLPPVDQMIGRGLRRVRTGEGTPVKPQDQVCHVVTHAAFKHVGLFAQYARYNASLDAEDEEVEDAVAVHSSSSSDEEPDWPQPGPSNRAAKRPRSGAGRITGPAQAAASKDTSDSDSAEGEGPDADVVTSVDRYLFPLPTEKQTNDLIELEKHYDTDAWAVVDKELPEAEEV